MAKAIVDPRIWLLVPVLGAVIPAARAVSDNSFLWHVRAGHLQAAAGEVLRRDPFSFTMAGEPWRTQSWLAELIYARFDGWIADLRWVPVFVLLIGVVTMSFVAIAVYRTVRNPLGTALVLVVVMWLLIGYLVPRPAVFSLLFLSVLVVVLACDRRLHWAALPLLWVWAAVHGSFVVGMGLVVLEALRLRSRRLGVVAALSVVAVSATAHGWHVWGVLLDFFRSRDQLALIKEWRPPDFVEPALAPYLLLIAGVVWAATSDRIERRDLIVVLPFMFFGLTSRRAVFQAAIVLAPFAALAVDRLRIRGDDRSRSSPILAWVVAGVLAASAVGAVAVTPGGVDREVFPVAAVAMLDGGRVFHDDRVGGYLIYARYPDIPVYVDDRAELYDGRYRDFLRAWAGEPVWREHFVEFDIVHALVEDGSALAGLLGAERWTAVTTDGDYTLYARPGG